MTETRNSNTLKRERPVGAENKSLEKKRRRNAILIQKVEKKRLDKENKDFKRKLTNITGIFHIVIKDVAYQILRKRVISLSDEPYRQ
jgi:hypothetical protein